MNSFNNKLTNDSEFGLDTRIAAEGTTTTLDPLALETTRAVSLSSKFPDRAHLTYPQDREVDSVMNSSGIQQTHSNTNSDINGMNDSSVGSSRNTDTWFGSSRTKDSFSAANGGYSGGDTAWHRDEFQSSGDRNESERNNTGKASMGDKFRGGAEKLAGKMMGNAGMQVRGQKRKMGEFGRSDF
ncbi:hypothetical protein C8R44DRAFT_865735 [Mycena epipterygia]|nr:hypothetical protein C8R44DRAFT_865735 [Mycena epipterygia]